MAGAGLRCRNFAPVQARGDRLRFYFEARAQSQSCQPSYRAADLVASALRGYYKKAGNTEAYGRVNFSKNYLQRLRDAQLVADTKAILAAAETVVAQPAAVIRGVTPGAIATLAAAIAAFEGLLTKPRTNLVTRNTLLRELATRVAGHLEELADLDDLVLQFGGTPAGQRFVAAWQAARVIVDAGGSQSPEEPATPAPAAHAPATPVPA